MSLFHTHHQPVEQARGSIVHRFDARDAHVVLSPGRRDPIPFRVLVDGEAPGAEAYTFTFGQL